MTTWNLISSVPSIRSNMSQSNSISKYKDDTLNILSHTTFFFSMLSAPHTLQNLLYWMFCTWPRIVKPHIWQGRVHPYDDQTKNFLWRTSRIRQTTCHFLWMKSDLGQVQPRFQLAYNELPMSNLASDSFCTRPAKQTTCCFGSNIPGRA